MSLKPALAWNLTYNMSHADCPIQFIDLAAQRSLIQNNLETAIRKVIEHGQFIQGPEVFELETQLKHYTGAKHVINCASGTDALKLLLMAQGLKPNEVVFLPAFTFAATAEVVAEMGAIPYFVDVCPKTFNIDPKSLEHAIYESKKANYSLKGIIAVDIFGLPANYTSLQQIADMNHLWLIADAAQSFGGSLQDKKVGTLANMTATSFFPSKPLGGYGDGGCVFTEDDDIAKIVRSLHIHGAGEHRYDHVRVGLNSRLDSIQAAILLEKLKLFDQELSRRIEIANFYLKNLSNLRTQEVDPNYSHAYGLFTLCVEDRDRFIEILKEQKIPSAIYYKKPLHVQPAYQHYPKVNETLPITDYLAQRVVSIPMHPYLTNEAVDKIITTIQQALCAA